MGNRVVVLGAGMIGVCCAIELRRAGKDVVLVDRREPGEETSYGNAGVVARSSLMPLNNPGLWRSLPQLLTNRTAAFRYNPFFLASNPRWGLGFLWRSRRSAFEETARALDSLIRLSSDLHGELLKEASAEHRRRDNGWLFLYRSEAGFAKADLARATFDAFGVDTEVLDGRGLSDLEPHLAALFARALWIRDTSSVDNPGAVVAAYAKLFEDLGGEIVKDEARGLVAVDGGYEIGLAEGSRLHAADVLIALGPWAREFLGRTGIRLPMAFERGYHMHYAADRNAVLGRPIYDTERGYVLSPMEQGLRLSTGVELTQRDAPRNTSQLDMVEASAREAFPISARLEEEPWMGSRPTLPDSRPIIDAVPRRPGLWLAVGHQHIGFSTGPGTGKIISALMDGKVPPIDATPFRAARFVA